MAAVAATLLGSVAAVKFMRSWGNMQGVTMISNAVAILLVVALAAWQVWPLRRTVPSAHFRRLFARSLYRLSAWALAGYMAYMVIGSMILTVTGFEYPK